MRKPDLVRPATLATNHTAAVCIHCGGVAQREAVFKQDGINIIEKYCDACMEPKAFERLQSIYSRVTS